MRMVQALEEADVVLVNMRANNYLMSIVRMMNGAQGLGGSFRGGAREWISPRELSAEQGGRDNPGVGWKHHGVNRGCGLPHLSELRLRPDASFLKGQGHQGIFFLVKGTL